jgi:hypothetical protein
VAAELEDYGDCDEEDEDDHHAVAGPVGVCKAFLHLHCGTMNAVHLITTDKR